MLNASPEQSEFSLKEDPDAVRWMQALELDSKSEVNAYRYYPNKLTDYQGYLLGMLPDEIDRLHAHRAKGRYLRSEAEFLAVTQIPENRWITIAPRIYFPKTRMSSGSFLNAQNPTPDMAVKDINKVSARALRDIPGIGPVLSERIVKFRNRLGGFQIMEQVYDVYGLDPEVAKRVLNRYSVLEKPQIERININQAPVAEIAKQVYLGWDVARQIVAYREQHGPLESLEELTKIEEFPADKIARISLYLSL